MLAIGCDHAATALKEELKAWLKAEGHEVRDYGVAAGEQADYPAVALRVARDVAGGVCERGVLLCGTGLGMSIAANKVVGIRAACCCEPCSARLAREHNDSNILCLGARVLGPELAKETLAAWLNAAFEGGRHTLRVEMIKAMEAGTEA
jgi:ribose 5-phosphate isomerase B